MNNSEIEDIKQAAERCNMDDAAYREYFARLAANLDYNTDIRGNRAIARAKGYEEGFKEGLAEARAEGLKEAILFSIRNLMKSQDISAQAAMEALMIPVEDWDRYETLL